MQVKGKENIALDEVLDLVRIGLKLGLRGWYEGQRPGSQKTDVAIDEAWI